MTPSPCVGKCQLNRENFCIGCGRSRFEIGQWTLVTGQRQAEIVVAARERLKKLDAAAASKEPNHQR